MWQNSTEPEIRVDRGADLLDEERPDWFRNIDLRTLNIGSPVNCVCGQLAGEGANWLDTLYTLGLGNQNAADYGFAEEVFCGEYPELNSAWRKVIKDRRKFDAEVTALLDDEARTNLDLDERSRSHQVEALA